MTATFTTVPVLSIRHCWASAALIAASTLGANSCLSSRCRKRRKAYQRAYGLHHPCKRSADTAAARAVPLTSPDQSSSTTAASSGCATSSQWQIAAASPRPGARTHVRLNQRDQLWPGHDLVHLIEEDCLASFFGQRFKAKRNLTQRRIVPCDQVWQKSN
jgi:hypothetical protein